MKRKVFNLMKSYGVGFYSIAVLFLVIGCSKDSEEISAKEVLSDKNDKTEIVVNEQAKIYFNNVKTMMYGTGALEKSASKTARMVSVDDLPQVPENPMIAKLEGLDIYNEDTQQMMSVYDMDDNERQMFIDKMLEQEIEDLSLKLENEPELVEHLAKENQIVSEVISSEGMASLEVGKTPEGQLTARKANIDPKAFFDKLNTRMQKELYAVPNEEVNTDNKTKRIIVDVRWGQKISPYKTKEAWRTSARRGDFVVALPSHGNPWAFFNVGADFKVGHAGIIAKNITYDTDIDADNVTVECYNNSGGVQRLPIRAWSNKHYVMGVQRIIWKWRWRGFRSGLYRIKQPVNPAPLADWAEGYLGRQYVRWYEFATAKWAAPSRFTCTTLVWYCAKRAYGVNVSSWYSPLVTPSGLYTDSCTYLRKEVR